MWAKRANAPEFYGTLPLVPGAMELFGAVKHLDPVILTGLPRGSWAAEQKVRWAAEHFPGTRIITCMAVNKRTHCVPGDVLVDDTLTHRPLWEEAGGIFIHHRSVEATPGALTPFFPLPANAWTSGAPAICAGHDPRPEARSAGKECGSRGG